jgi:sensor histidine kinase regulating citrate/malate metabolism
MAGFYQAYTTGRATEPDAATLLASLRALDATAGVQHQPGPAYVIKKATTWTAPQIAAAQTVIDTAPAATPQRAAQSTIDSWPLDLKAAFILVMEQMNVLRAFHSLPAFTVQQFTDAIKTKAGTL